ncbi:MAG: NAD(+)/NADH kinase [Planctomycetales bacterium]
MSEHANASSNATTKYVFENADAPRRVMILGAGDKPQVVSELDQVRRVISERDEIAACDMTFTEDLANVEADLAVVLGGDGSILRAARQMGHVQHPTLGINLGKLGFLAHLSPEEFRRQWASVRLGEFQVRHCLMLECVVERDGTELARRLALNEAAVRTGKDFQLLDVHLYVDAERATAYSCDGLILSTPIGSTAHSLSAGGPILRNDLQAIVISPISPHTLTVRPVVDSAERVYELVVPRPAEGTAVIVDGQVLAHLKSGDRVRVSKAKPEFQMIVTPGHSYYQTLRHKLGWSGRPNYQSEDG